MENTEPKATFAFWRSWRPNFWRSSVRSGVFFKQHIMYKNQSVIQGYYTKCSAKKLNVRAGQVRSIPVETSILTAAAALYRTKHEKAFDNLNWSVYIHIWYVCMFATIIWQRYVGPWGELSDEHRGRTLLGVVQNWFWLTFSLLIIW